MSELFEKHPVLYHYTDFDGLKGILDSQQLWAKHYKSLNDLSEVTHMRGALVDMIEPTVKQTFRALCSKDQSLYRRVRKHGGVKQVSRESAAIVIDNLYDNTFGNKPSQLRFADPYITSFCSHQRDSEYIRCNGQLSMWRYYGANGGFALMFNTEGLVELIRRETEHYSYTPPVGVFIGDVIYDNDPEGSNREFKELISQLERLAPDLIQGKTDDVASLLPPFVLSVCRFKHQGFVEESEVRIVAPVMTGNLYLRIVKEGKETRKAKQVKVRGTGRIKYVELFGFKDKPLPIEHIIVGPQTNQERRFDEVNALIQGTGITLSKSDTPFVAR